MNMTAMAYQRQLDEDGDLANEAERLEEECRRYLLNMYAWPAQGPYSDPPKAERRDFTEALYDLCEDELCDAFALLDSDPAKALWILKECRRKAVEDVLGRMDFEAIVKANNEQEQAA